MKPSAKVEIELRTLGLEPKKFTDTGAPSTDKTTIFELAGSPNDDPAVYGNAYDVFGGGEAGASACEALWALGSVGAINPNPEPEP